MTETNTFKKILGLDIGIASVGWALINLDDENLQCSADDNGEVLYGNGNIIDCGVRVFDAPEIGAKKAPSAEPRRIARLSRKRLFRRARRKQQIKDLCIEYGLVKKEDVYEKDDNIFVNYDGEANYKDVWILRKEALERCLTGKELARVLTHIVKHRGWKTNRKSEEVKPTGDNAKMKGAIENTAKLINENCKTIGYYYGEKKAQSDNPNNFRIKNEEGKYDRSIGRITNLQEIEEIFKAQKSFGSQYTDDDFQKKVKEIFDWQETPKSIKDMVGNCMFEPTEYRAPKESYSAEIFNVYTKINNLKLDLTQEEYEKLVDLFKTKKEVKYKDVKKALGKGDNFKFDNLDYFKAEYETKDKNGKLSKTAQNKIEKYASEGYTTIVEKEKNPKVYFKNDKGEYKYEDPEEDKIFSMVGYHKVKTTLKDNKEGLEYIEANPFAIDTIMQAMSYEKSDNESRKYMEEHNVPDFLINDCLKIEASKFIHISCKAIQNLLPYLKAGDTYDKACTKAGYDFKNEKIDNTNIKLPAIDDIEDKIQSHVVKRAISQTRKVINAIVSKYGKFDQVNIEFTRDLGKSAKERKNIEDRQKELAKEKQKIGEEYSNYNGGNGLTDKQILKLRLYKEQEGKSLYSMETIDVSELLSDEKYCEIDHILPYSKSFDDSLSNKVLVLAKDNQNKKNRTPYEYLKDITDWDDWKQKIWAMKGLSYRKKKNLTVEEPDFSKWKARNLNDTSYVAKYLVKYLKQYLQFRENDKIKNKVQVRPGVLTAQLRHCWGLEKNREESDLHHMQDAIVIACSTQSMCEAISYTSARRKFEKPEEIIAEIEKEIAREKNSAKPDQEKIDILEKRKQRTKKFARDIAADIEKEIIEEKNNLNPDLEKIKKLENTYAKVKGIYEKIQQKKYKLFSKPWDHFVEEVLRKKLDFIITDNATGLPKDKIVSRMPRRKVTGEAHAATIAGFDKENKKQYNRVAIKELKLDTKCEKSIEHLRGKDDYCKQLYELLKEKLEHGEIKEPVYMPTTSGEQGPEVKKVTLESNWTGGGVEVNKGIATNGGMPRVDIYLENGKYYAVPVYIADFIEKKLPNIAKPSNKPMDDKNFVFSLYKDEPVFFKHKNGTNYFGYFCSFDATANTIKIESSDKSSIFDVGKNKTYDIRISIGSVITLTKYQVDPLGYITKVKGEKRLGNNLKKSRKKDKNGIQQNINSETK